MEVTRDGDGFLYRCVCGWERKYPRLTRMNCPACKRKAGPTSTPTEPSLARKAVNFAVAGTKHLAAGRPQATDEQVAARFEICKGCELFKPKQEGYGVCQHPSCGCALKTVGLAGMNKLRWADQVCPIGKWGAEN